MGGCLSKGNVDVAQSNLVAPAAVGTPVGTGVKGVVTSSEPACGVHGPLGDATSAADPKAAIKQQIEEPGFSADGMSAAARAASGQPAVSIPINAKNMRAQFNKYTEEDDCSTNCTFTDASNTQTAASVSTANASSTDINVEIMPPESGHAYKVHLCGPPKPPCDEARLATVHQLNCVSQCLDIETIEAPPDPEVSSILKLVASIFQAPAVLVALFDDKRIFIRDAEGGFSRGDFPWRWSFCGWTMSTKQDQIMVIPDATKDDRFKDNEMVTGPMGVRFYCGTPLLASNGHRLGTLCFADQKPRTFDASSAMILNNMAELVVRHIEKDIALQLKQADNTQLVKAYDSLKRTMDCFENCVLLIDTSEDGWRVLYTNSALTKLAGMKQEELVGCVLSDLVVVPEGAALPSQTHIRLAAESKDFEMRGVRLRSSASRSGQHASGGNSITLATAMTSANSTASSSFASNKPVVLKFRPAGREAFDDDALPIGIPSIVPRSSTASTTDSKSGGAERPERFYFMSVEVAAAPMQGTMSSSISASQYQLSLSSSNSAEHIDGLETAHLLGKGAFGSVYYGTWFGTPVAVKVVDQDIRGLGDGSSDNGGSNAQASNSNGTSIEAMLGQELRHPHVVSTLTYKIKRIGGHSMSHNPDYLTVILEDGNSAVVHDLDDGPQSDANVHAGNWAVMNLDDSMQDQHSVTNSAADKKPQDTCASVGVEATGYTYDEMMDDEGGFSRNDCTPMMRSGPPCAKGPPKPKYDGERFQTWIVMEYCDRGSLQDATDRGWLRKPRPEHDPRPPSIDGILVTAHEIAGALSFLHSRGVIHGDLSAWNVMLCSSGQSANVGNRGFVAKIADFGLARSLNVQTMIQTRTYGTLTHMPAETLTHGHISRATDVYSLGVLMWQMWTGSRPWAGMSHGQIIVMVASHKANLQFPPDTPPAYAKLAQACMAFDPEARPTCAEVVKRLDAIMAECAEEETQRAVKVEAASF